MKKIFLGIALIGLFTTEIKAADSYENCYGAENCSSCGENCYYTYSGTTLNVYGPIEKNDDGSYKESAQVTNNAFYNGNSTIPITVTNVKMSGNITSIGKSAFTNSKTIKSIDLPESLTSIGEDAFWGTGVTDIYIPKNVTTIGGDAFRYSSLENLTFAADSKMTETGSRSFLLATNLKNVILPDGLKTISVDTFYGCGKLTNVTIPDSVKTIYGSSFYGAYAITELTASAENITRFLTANKNTCSGYCGGDFKSGVDIKINCTGTKDCKEALKTWLAQKYGEDETQWPSWYEKTDFNNKIYVQNYDGSISVYTLGKFTGYINKRIYSPDEAAALAKPNGNTVSITW